MWKLISDILKSFILVISAIIPILGFIGIHDYNALVNKLKSNSLFKPADYTKYDKAVEQANAIDRSLYKDFTALDEALSVDVSGKNITGQDIVDVQTKAILDALNALEKKPVPISCTVALLTLFSACIFITSGKKKCIK